MSEGRACQYEILILDTFSACCTSYLCPRSKPIGAGLREEHHLSALGDWSRTVVGGGGLVPWSKCGNHILYGPLRL